MNTRLNVLGRAPAAAAGWLALLLGWSLAGCTHWDSYLDPSVLGRWERTPTVVPILERISAIEEGQGQFTDFSEPTEDDLIPQTEQYVIQPGDTLEITILDLLVQSQPELVAARVDQNGFITLPLVGRVFIAGRTEDQAQRAIEDAVRPVVQDPTVTLVVLGRRAQTYTLQGNVTAPGQYLIPAADYRLLEALVAAGGVNEATSDFVFVIRQVALDERIDALPPEPGNVAPRSGDDRPPVNDDEDFDDLVRQIIEEEDEREREDPPPPLPGVMRGGLGFAGGSGQPAPVIDLDDPRAPAAAERPAAAGQPEAPPPVVDMIQEAAEPEPVRPGEAPEGGRWLFLNGEWVRAAAPRPAADPRPEAAEAPAPVVTQRVIRVPLDPLLAGDAKFNIVVRPQDVIRVPPPELGNVYVSGQVLRPGVYSLPAIGRLTLQRVVAAAGDLSGLAIPERVDIVRVVGPNRQATVMLNLRAIAEGTQPDVYLKPDDLVRVGTNFWAAPLAVLRGGLRASYGFGFLLDRNFGNDVFGAPPTNIGGG